MPDLEAADLGSLLEIDGNPAALTALIAQVRSSGSITPFVGAGMSVPFRFPTWREFLLNQARGPDLRAEVERLLDAGQYEEAAEQLVGAVGVELFHLAVRDGFAPEKLPAEPADAAVRCIPDVGAGPVITTNFDRVLEFCFERAGRALRADEVIIGMQLDRIRDAVQKQQRALIKIHGDAGERRDRVFTQSDYERQYQTEHPLQRVIRMISARALLFIGCSLEQDRTVRVLESYVAEQRGVVPHFFAVLALPDTPEKIEKRRAALSKAGLVPVWFPKGRFDLITALLRRLATEAKGALVEARKAEERAQRTVLHLDLPKPPPVWTARSGDMSRLEEELGAALLQYRAVVVEGPRGTGKTALAERAIDQALKARNFGAIAYMSAKNAPISLAELLDRISLTLDFPNTIQLPLEQKPRAVVDELAKKGFQVLIAVDNYETVSDAAVLTFLETSLPPNCTLLVTKSNREPRQTDSVKIFAIDEFIDDDAYLFFSQHLQENGLRPALRPAFDRLWAKTGGNAFILEKVAGRMSAGDELSWIIEDFEKGEGTPFDILLGASWRDVEDVGRSLLCAASMFATDASDAALLAVSGLERRPYRRAVAQLKLRYLLKSVDMHGSSLVEPDMAEASPVSRFAMHPMTREFAQSKLRELPDADAVAERMGSFFLDLLQRHGGSPDKEARTDLHILDAERANVLLALDQLSSRGRWEKYLAMMQSIVRWLFINGMWAQLEVRAKTGERVAKERGNQLALARILAERGRVDSQRGLFVDAERTLGQAVEAARAAGNEGAEGYAMHHLGEMFIRQKRYAEAEATLDASLDAVTRGGSRREQIGVRYRIAELAYRRGDLKVAKEKFVKGVEDTRAEHWDRLESYHHNFLADIALAQNDLAEARLQWARARELVPPTDARRLAFLESTYAQLRMRENAKEDAMLAARQARDHFVKLDMRTEVDDVTRLLSEIERG